MELSVPNIRRFLTKAISDDEFMAFCRDYFRNVYENFAGGMTREQKGLLLLDYCDRHGVVSNLLANSQKEWPDRYRQWFEQAPDSRMPERPLQPVALQRDPRQVFISHAHQDADVAHRLAGDLQAGGWRVWIAPDSVQPGERWADAIERGLDTSGVFVLLLTPEAVRSTWVRSETNIAIQLEHEGRARFVPLYVKDCDVPSLCRAYQRISFQNGYERGLASLLAWLEPRPPAVPPLVPEPPARSEPPIIHKPAAAAPVTVNLPISNPAGIEWVEIPAGEFLYGDEEDQMTVSRPYWIGKYPVTQAQYQRFIDANPQYPVPFSAAAWAKPYNWDKKTHHCPPGKLNHPVILVSWRDAQAFCAWAGCRLPTEIEWERAARGVDGRRYPWGEAWVDGKYCNSEEAVIGGTTPVDQYPAGISPDGVWDMSGNVYEWTDSTWVSGYVIRGGSWVNGAFSVRAANRGINSADARDGVGFRCCVASR